MMILVKCLRHSCRFWCADVCEIGHKSIDNIEGESTQSAGTNCGRYRRQKPEDRLWLNPGNGKIW